MNVTTRRSNTACNIVLLLNLNDNQHDCSYHLLILIIVNRKPINSIGNLSLGTRLQYRLLLCYLAICEAVYFGEKQCEMNTVVLR